MFLNTKLNILLPITVFFILGITYSNYGDPFFINYSLFYNPSSFSNSSLFSNFSLFSGHTALSLILGLIIILGLMLVITKKTKIATKTKEIPQRIFSRKNILIFFLFTLAFATGIACHRHQIQTHEEFLNKINNKTYSSIIATVKDIKRLKNKRNSVYMELLWESENKNISLYTNGCHDLEVADRIEIKNATFKRPNNKDFLNYLIKEDIATTLFITSLEYEVVTIPEYSVARWLHNKKNNILNSLKAKMSPILFAAFSSIFLGYRNISKEIEDSIKNKFKEWGILHILARSGLHLIVFLLICDLLLKFIPIYFFIKQIIILFITIIYTLLSWSSISFLRAFCALILYKICPFVGRKSDAVHVVTIVCLGIIMLNPIQIFFLDFQLSFLLTFSLAVISRIETRRKRKQPEKNTPKPLGNK